MFLRQVLVVGGGSRTVLNGFKGGARHITFLRSQKKERKAIHFSEEPKKNVFEAGVIGLQVVGVWRVGLF